MPELRCHDEVYVLDLGEDENRFSLDWMSSVSTLIDEVSRQPAPRALVTVSRGKFYSNGLDLDWVLSHRDQAGAYVGEVHRAAPAASTSASPRASPLLGHARP